GRAAARRRRAEFLRAALGAVTYPAVLFGLLFVASLATMAIIGPTLAVVLAVAYAGSAAGLVVLARKLGRGDSSLVRYPVIGGVVQEMQELPYLEALHALYGAGVPVVDAHRAASPTVKMQGLRAQLGIAQRMLEQGKSLHEALHGAAALSQETRTLLATGEQAGELEEALQRALTRRAEMAERRLRAAARALGAVAYATAAVGVGAIVVMFYTNYYAPIFALMR
ncbi:MAG: type II secretion system F family protein, partial [Planctomycetota bacterium]